MTAQTSSRCDHCHQPFTIPAHAGHKRFCTASCKQAWHTDQRRKGALALKTLAAQSAQAKEAAE